MALQLEKGTQFPMRPAAITVQVNDATPFKAPRDAAPVDWTAAGTKIAVDGRHEFMDGEAYITMNASDNDADLRAGIYEINVTVQVENLEDSNNEKVRLAITNAAGSTVHQEGEDFMVSPSSMGEAKVHARIHLATDDTVVFRAAQTTDTGGVDDIRIADDAFVGTIVKLGNANESA